MSMLGSRTVDNTLTGLVSLVSEPKKFKAAVAELKTATEEHRAARDEAAKQKREADEALERVNSRIALLEAFEQRTVESQEELRTAQGRLQQAQARLDQAQAEHAQLKRAAEIDHGNRVIADNRAIAAEKNDLARSKAAHLEALAKSDRELRARKAELDAQAGQQARRQAELQQLAAQVSMAEAEVRDRIRKVNELFAT